MSRIDSEMPLSEFGGSEYEPDLFIYTEAASGIIENPKFIALYDQFKQMAKTSDENGRKRPNLEPENDDSGSTEYKLLMCGLTKMKVYKRMTQMKWRLLVSKHPNSFKQLRVVRLRGGVLRAGRS